LVFSLSNLGLDAVCGAWACAGKDYLWSLLGDGIGAVIILIIAKFKCMFLNINP
jgi:hypothetical protein